MHIPDGFLDTKTIVATSVCSAAGAAAALRRVRAGLAPKTVPLIALSAAFTFVAQMVNFPVGGGTSGHLLGATLIAILLGPHIAVIVMGMILVVQCFLFADGGALALGANFFTMGLVAPLTGYAIFALVRRIVPGTAGLLTGAAFGGWMSTVIASVACAGQLAWSGLLPWQIAFPAMAGVHMLVGLGEGLITSLVLASILASRPELIRPDPVPAPNAAPTGNGLFFIGSIVVIGLLLFVSPFASRWPDGLERVAATFGFDVRAVAQSPVPSPLANYRIPILGSLPLATIVAGLAGCVIVFVLSHLLARALAKRSGVDGNSVSR